MPAIITSVLALALAAGPASPAPTALPSLPPAMMKMAMPSFTAKDAAIAVKAGQPFQLRMHVTSGNGYTWQPRGPLPPGLALLGVFQTPRGKMMPGGPGEQVLVFRATDAGQLKITLDYVRPWEHGVKPAKQQTFSIKVHK